MVKQRLLVVGLGEVGLPLYVLAKENATFAVYGFDLDEEKMRRIGQTTLSKAVDVIHVCIPCTSRDSFVHIVKEYVERFKPELVIIHSTIPPGTTMNIQKKCKGCLVAHSPVRGVHKSTDYMKWELKRWTKYVGGANKEAAETARKHLEKLGLRTKVSKSSTETELGKLFETTYRAWMIACFQEMHRTSMHFKADFNDVVDFLQDTHKVRFDRPVMFPDVIGGHCLIPNIKLLLEDYDSKFLRLILDSNEERKKEVKERKVSRDIEKLRKKIQSTNTSIQKTDKD